MCCNRKAIVDVLVARILQFFCSGLGKAPLKIGNTDFKLNCNPLSLLFSCPLSAVAKQINPLKQLLLALSESTSHPQQRFVHLQQFIPINTELTVPK